MDYWELEGDIGFIAGYLNPKLDVGYIRYDYLGGSTLCRLKTKTWEITWYTDLDTIPMLGSVHKGKDRVDANESYGMEHFFRRHAWRQYGRNK